MQTRLVYRMEDADGVGAFQALPEEEMDTFNDLHPFTAGKSWNADDPAKRLNQAEYEAKFPTPFNDPILKDHFLPTGPFTMREEEDLNYCGCCSKEQLAEWFPPETTDLLDRYGVQFTVWRVPDDRVLDGATQALFDRDAAHCIERHPASALHAERKLAA